MKDETIWLSLDQMTILFDRDKSVISKHIKKCIKRRIGFNCRKICDS